MNITEPQAGSDLAAILFRPPDAIRCSVDSLVSGHNAHAAARDWADAAGARRGTARIVQRGKRYLMTVTDFKHGASLVATLIEVDGLGHAWSAGSANKRFSDSLGPDASRPAGMDVC